MKAQIIKLDSHRKGERRGCSSNAVGSFRLARVSVQGDRIFVSIVISSQENWAAMETALHEGVLESRWWSHGDQDMEEKDWICLWLIKFSEPLGVVMGVLDPEETGLQPLVEMVPRRDIYICYRIVHPDRAVIASFDTLATEREKTMFNDHSLRQYCSNDIERRFGINLCRALMQGVDTIWSESRG